MQGNDLWRELVSERCGGADFDAPSGGYAFSAILAEERKLASGNQLGNKTLALLKLSIADPTWKAPAEAIKAAGSYYEESDDATRYTDNTGIPGTHQAIADCLNGKFGLALTPDNVQYSPGAIKRLLAEYVPAAFFDEMTTLYFPTPGYGVITSPINNHGIQVVNLPLVDGCCRIPYENAICSDYHEKKFIYLNVPHNPTGLAWTKEDWQRFLCWASENGVFAIVDEAYVDLIYNESAASILEVPGWEEHCLVLQSISKGWNATGFRFGWAVGNETAIKALRKVMDVKDSGMLGLTIAAGLECLNHPEWALETKKRYRDLHSMLRAALHGAGFTGPEPQAGLCQFTRAPRSADGQEFGSIVECAQWFREKLRISLMHYEVGGEWYLRWAVTIKPVPECGLPDEKTVIAEVASRLSRVKFEF